MLELLRNCSIGDIESVADLTVGTVGKCRLGPPFPNQITRRPKRATHHSNGQEELADDDNLGVYLTILKHISSSE